jgi:ABC-type molybdate transport system substrate-binding protein
MSLMRSIGRGEHQMRIEKPGFLPIVFTVLAFVFPLADAGAQSAKADIARKLVMLSANHDNDLKFYPGDGRFVKGLEALRRMQTEADLVLWLAGNQFFAMDDVIGAFQKENPGIKVGLLTLPPGLLLSAIEKGGWIYGTEEFSGTPDVYASVNLEHLKQLKKDQLMETYAVYVHNELQIMVAKGNPKKVMGIQDLARSDVRTTMPNPINNGIMQFYARKVLERHRVWEAISAGMECSGCQTTERNWFAAVHHRETPERIRDDKTDAGIVWATEIAAALRDGFQIEGVRLPSEDSLRDEVGYAVGTLSASGHEANAEKFLAFLAMPVAQQAYARFGFVNATAEELRLKSIP